MGTRWYQRKGPGCQEQRESRWKIGSERIQFSDLQHLLGDPGVTAPLSGPHFPIGRTGGLIHQKEMVLAKQVWGVVQIQPSERVTGRTAQHRLQQRTTWNFL